MSRLLGIDVGDKTLGLALSDELHLTAQGVKTLRRSTPRGDLAALRALVEEHAVSDIVVGLPRSLDGTLGPQAEKVLAFVDLIAQELNLPVHTWDERLTTVAAQRALHEMNIKNPAKRRRVIDTMAAQLILQGYLDHQYATRSKL